MSPHAFSKPNTVYIYHFPVTIKFWWSNIPLPSTRTSGTKTARAWTISITARITGGPGAGAGGRWEREREWEWECERDWDWEWGDVEQSTEGRGPRTASSCWPCGCPSWPSLRENRFQRCLRSHGRPFGCECPGFRSSFSFRSSASSSSSPRPSHSPIRIPRSTVHSIIPTPGPISQLGSCTPVRPQWEISMVITLRRLSQHKKDIIFKFGDMRIHSIIKWEE